MVPLYNTTFHWPAAGMEARDIIELIKNNRFCEAYKEVASKDFEIQSLYPNKHSQWRHVVRAKLREVTPASTLDYATKASFFLCLATCFEYLNDDSSKLAAQYQVVVNAFKYKNDTQEKVDILALFGNECAQKGYLQQAIMAYEEIIRGTNDNELRDTLLCSLKQLYQERFLKYFLANNELFESYAIKSPKLGCVERKEKGVRKAEQELMRRKQLRRMHKDTL